MDAALGSPGLPGAPRDRWGLPEQEGHTNSEIHLPFGCFLPPTETRRAQYFPGLKTLNISNRSVIIWGSYFRHTVYLSDSLQVLMTVLQSTGPLAPARRPAMDQRLPHALSVGQVGDKEGKASHPRRVRYTWFWNFYHNWGWKCQRE